MEDGTPRPARTGLATILLAASIALAGWFIGAGVRDIRTADRFVTVKGVAEREAKADLALSRGRGWGPGGPAYLFRRLNDVKPSMMAEATAEAGKAAEQFAKD